MGGVIFTPDGEVQYFGLVLNESTVEKFKVREEQVQVIGQAEILPVVIAKLTWKNLLKDRKAIFFIDNEAARLGLVKSYSPVLPSLELIMQSAVLDYEGGCVSWSLPSVDKR